MTDLQYKAVFEQNKELKKKVAELEKTIKRLNSPLGVENKLREALEKYSEWLQDSCYLDTDWQSEEPNAIDAYIESLAATKENK